MRHATNFWFIPIIRQEVSMNHIKITDIVNPGTEEYLFLLLAADASGRRSGEITSSDIENYLKGNPEEAEIFDASLINGVKRKLRTHPQYKVS